MASKELIDKLNSLSKEQLIDNYITLDTELERLEDIENKYYKLEKNLKLYKKAFDEALDKIVRPYIENKELRKVLKSEFLDKARKDLEDGK